MGKFRDFQYVPDITGDVCAEYEKLKNKEIKKQVVQDDLALLNSTRENYNQILNRSINESGNNILQSLADIINVLIMEIEGIKDHKIIDDTQLELVEKYLNKLKEFEERRREFLSRDDEESGIDLSQKIRDDLGYFLIEFQKTLR